MPERSPRFARLISHPGHLFYHSTTGRTATKLGQYRKSDLDVDVVVGHLTKTSVVAGTDSWLGLQVAPAPLWTENSTDGKTRFDRVDFFRHRDISISDARHADQSSV